MHDGYKRRTGCSLDRNGLADTTRSLFATAKLNGLDAARQLADTPEKLPGCPNSEIDPLLPFTSSTRH
jgi:transposase